MRKQLLDTPKLGSAGGVIGRPRAEPPADAAERIREAAAQGATMVGVGNAVGVSREILKRWMDEDEELREAFDAGRELERHELHNMLSTSAKKGNIIAAMFLLKARHGYREGDQGEQGNRVNVTFNLPGAMTIEQFAGSNKSKDDDKQ